MKPAKTLGVTMLMGEAVLSQTKGCLIAGDQSLETALPGCSRNQGLSAVKLTGRELCEVPSLQAGIDRSSDGWVARSVWRLSRSALQPG
jgi:hypothetical protein